MSGRQARVALIISVPLIYSDICPQTQHSSTGTMKPYQPAMKLLFIIKPVVT